MENNDTINSEICDFTMDWVQGKTDYTDPHDCQMSCDNPSYGCHACTNKRYFNCTKNGVEICLHPDLVCDGHPQCDHALDEDFDQCYEKYLDLGIINEYATLKCRSSIYEGTFVSQNQDY